MPLLYNKGMLRKIIKIILIFIFGLGIFCLILKSEFFIFSEKGELVFFDVGQGDSALIKTPSKQLILIDGGPDNLLLRRLGDYLPFYHRRIDVVIFSHYHDDHITGLLELISRYRVNKIIYAPTNFSSPALDGLMKIVDNKELSVELIYGTARLEIDSNCFIDLLNPDSLGIEEDENNSLYARLNCGGQTVLFTGDSDYRAERAVIASGWNVQANILKGSHHGSKTANSMEFLKMVKPKLMVVSVGADNKFGHPHPDVLDRAADLGIDIKRTDEAGNIKILID